LKYKIQAGSYFGQPVNGSALQGDEYTEDCVAHTNFVNE
jgi:hypothetical protein